MSISYDVFTQAFLDKITGFDFPNTPYEANRQVDGYMKRAISEFKWVCRYDLSSTSDDLIREFSVDVALEDVDELSNIISEGMVVHWLKPRLFHQSNMENVLNTKDYSSFSPSELLNRMKDVHATAKRDFSNMKKEYSFDHGDLTELSL